MQNIDELQIWKQMQTLLMFVEQHLYHGRQLARRDDKNRCIERARETLGKARTIVHNKLFNNTTEVNNHD
ncbi:MAG: hypothetical protein IJS08_15805 [Victivallales bacterium]|nr:hypothetical protein [Victivallales bacterium]